MKDPLDRLPSPGLFWLPDAPEEQYFGTLEGTRGVVKLSIVGALEQQSDTLRVSTDYFRNLPLLPVVFGIVRGSLVTLLDLTKGGIGASMPAFQEGTYRPEYLIFGRHLDPRADQLPTGAAIKLSRLLHWHGTRGFIGEAFWQEGGPSGGQWTYSSPEAFEWHVGQYSIALRSSLDSRRDWDRLEALEYGFFKVMSSEPMTPRQWDRAIVRPLHEMLKFALFEPVTLDRVRLSIAVPSIDMDGEEATEESFCELVINRWQETPATRPSSRDPEMLFGAADVTNEALGRFLELDDRIGTVRSRLIGYERTAMSADDFFLGYVRLLESWHRILHGASDQDIRDHEQRLERIAASLSAEDAEFIRTRLRTAYEPSLVERLHVLAKPWKPRLKPVVGGGAALASVIRSIADHRNFLAHELPEEERVLAGDQLDQANKFLMILSRLVSLRDAHFDDSVCLDLVQATQLYRVWVSGY